VAALHFLQRALAQSVATADPNSEAAAGWTWNGQQWVPAQGPQVDPNGNIVQPQYQTGPSDAGNNSIASHGGGNGILGFLMGLA
jgi:hypothetical protein